MKIRNFFSEHKYITCITNVGFKPFISNINNGYHFLVFAKNQLYFITQFYICASNSYKAIGDGC